MNADDFNIYFKNKRDQYMVQIRKRKNEEFIERKRQKLTGGPRNDATDPLFQRSNLEVIEFFNNLATQFCEYLKTRDFEGLAKVCEELRKAVSRDENPPTQQLINTGIVSHIIQLLDYDYFQYENLMVECAWVIANIASGDTTHVKFLIQNEVVTYALKALDHTNDNVKDNAVWILSNVAGDSLDGRDALLQQGIIEHIEKLLDGNAYQSSFIAHTTWLISNLLRGKPYPDYEQIQPLLNVIEFFVKNVENDEIMNNCMWALSYCSDGTDEQIEKLFKMEVVGKVVELLGHEEQYMVAPALRVVGNLVTGKDIFTDVLLELGIITPLAALLNSPKKIFRKEACWALSNILAGPAHQVEEVFTYNNREIIKKLFNMAVTDDFEIRRECIFCLTNACSEGTLREVQILVEYDLIQLIVDTLRNNNEAIIIKACLEALESILNNGKATTVESGVGINPFVIRLTQAQGLPVVESLQSHPSNEVYQIVARIIEDHLEFD